VPPEAASKAKITNEGCCVKTILIDTGFWYAFCDVRDGYHEQAERKGALLETSMVLFPWPCLYETFNTRFAKNTLAVHRFERLLRQPHITLLSDLPYRDAALEAGMRAVVSRSMALVDMVIRFILDDVNVRKHGLLTFNHGDFSDLCRKHRIEML
jgi:predicted nucleic acid-binding protein